MTALDDAIGESSVVYGPHQIYAYWRESDRADDDNENADSPVRITDQSDGSLVISHALNDALPDSVTMTGDGDASGILTAGLIGKEGLVLGSSGFRPWDGGGDSWDSAAATTDITAPIPNDTIRDDFRLAAILIDDSSASLVQTTVDPKDQWDFHGSVSDGTLSLYVFSKRRNKSHNPSLTLTSDKPVNYMSLSIGFWARNPQLMAMDYRVTDISLVAEGSTVTSHSVSSKLSDTGYQVGFWGSAAVGAWTATAPMTMFGDPALNGLVLMAATSPLRDSGVYTLNATQSPANNNVVMVAVSLEPYQRPRMDARQYFSPYNPDSPVYGWDRDTADVEAIVRVLTADGPWDTHLFSGRMQGIPVRGRTAEMRAVSKTRINLNRSLPLPMVSGSRESCTVDWLVTYLMARGGSFVGPAPNPYTRYWAPLYGSVHAHWDSPQSYNASYRRDSANPFLLFGLRDPQVIPGRWLTAMYGQQTATEINEVSLLPRRMYEFSREDFPHLYDEGAPGPLMRDMISLDNSKGRLQFWVRGDAATSAPAYVTAGDDFLVKMHLQLVKDGVHAGRVEVGVASNSRNGYILMGSTAAGFLSTSFVMPGNLPTDGEWHYYGFWWDYEAGTGNCCFDGTVITANGWNTGGYNDISMLPATDEIGRNSNYTTSLSIKSHLPISDVILDFGEDYVGGQWTRFYPTPETPGANATYRATNIPLAAISEPTAVNAWETLADLARSVMAWYRCDENDAYNFLPLGYFGESAQMTPVAVQDTTLNAAELDVIVDPSKIRNVVTVQFPDTRVDTQPQFVLQYLTSTPLPKGVSTITFPLDVPIVELHGQASQSGGSWEIVNLTSSQITTPSLPKANHFITVTTGADGGGTVLAAASVSAAISQWDAGSVTLQFTNRTGSTVYLANAGDQVPFLQILGYGVRISDAYTTMRDTYSVSLRRERALTAEMPWIQTREIAEIIAMQMVNCLSKPVALVSVTVKGHPDRKPGQMVTVLDAEGTKVSGTWRILSIEHEAESARYTQNLLLMSVGPIMYWDDADTTWDHSVWGE